MGAITGRDSHSEPRKQQELDSAQTLDRALAEAIDESLMALGENIRRVIYYILENGYNLRRENIPKKPDIFDTGLRDILGQGALVVEVDVIKRLYAKLGFTYEERVGWSFETYIAKLRKARQERAQQSSAP